MTIQPIQYNNKTFLEILSDEIILSSTQDILDLIWQAYGYDSNIFIIYEKNISPEFFDLKTRVAGDILQKISNYDFQLIIIGNFDKYESQNLKNFILESNKSGRVYFVDSLSQALPYFNS